MYSEIKKFANQESRELGGTIVIVSNVLLVNKNPRINT